MASSLKADWPIAACFVALGASLTIVWGCLAEDAWIVARYAANLVDGRGLVYNDGQRISALTSPLHVFLLAPLEAALGRSIEPYAILSGLGTAFAFWYGARTLFASPQRRVWFLALGLLFPALAFWSIGGLETPVLTLLLLAMLVAWNAAPATRESASIVVVVCATLAVLARYDAVLLVAPATLYLLVAQRHSARMWFATALCASLVLAWLAFSFFYFGDILPTSYYQKNPTEFSTRELFKGAVYELSFLALLLSPLAVAWWLGSRNSLPQEDARGMPQWPLVIGLVLFFAYGLSAGIKHMMYLYRLFVPCVPWLAWLLVRRMTVFPARRGLVAALVLQVAWMMVIYHESLNLNITVPFVKDASGEGMFEFDHVGARYNKLTDRVYAAQAPTLRAHWAGQPHRPGEVAPRIFSITGGQPPYQLRDWFVYEGLSGLRKQCRYDFALSAHYRQHIGVVKADGTQLNPPPVAPWQLVTSTDTPVKSRLGDIGSLRIAWYYQPDPMPNRLPDSIDAPCLAPTASR